jgi:hypothetical protein
MLPNKTSPPPPLLHLTSSITESRQSNNGHAPILNSWKQIAAYLGRGVRTVQRWERNFGLPVHRPIGHDRSAVVAVIDEVNAWLRSTPVRGKRSAGSTAAGDSVVVLLELARGLLAVGEQLVVRSDQQHRTEAEKLVSAIRERVRDLMATEGLSNRKVA